MGILGQEWRAWSTSSSMTCLGDSYAVLRLQTMKTLWATQLWKNVSEKCVKGTCEKFCEKNRAKNNAKNCAKKIVKNRQKKPLATQWKMRKVFVNKPSWDRRQNHFWVRKKFHGIFHLFRARLSAALCWRGWGLWLMGTISVALSARAHARVATPHCQHVSRTRHIYEHVFLHIFGKYCSSLS